MYPSTFDIQPAELKWDKVLVLGKDIEVLLKKVTIVKVKALDINGKLAMERLMPSAKYKVTIEVMLLKESSGWDSPVTFTIQLPGVPPITREQILGGLSTEIPMKILFGCFDSPIIVAGDLTFEMSSASANLNKGLVLGPISFHPIYPARI